MNLHSKETPLLPTMIVPVCGRLFPDVEGFALCVLLGNGFSNVAKRAQASLFAVNGMQKYLKIQTTIRV